MKDLNSFLDDQRTGLFDSTGEFTIAAEKALEKLAASQLSNPAMWVLKVVQFAACFGAGDLHFVFDRKITRISGRLPRPLALPDFQRGLDNFEPLEDRALEALVVAIRALGSFSDRKFVVQLSGTDQVQYLTWDGGKLSATSRSESTGELSFCIEATSSNPASWLNFQAMNRRAQEAQYLYTQAIPAPCEITVDGRRLKGDPLRTARGLAEVVWTDFCLSDNGFPLPAAFDSLFTTSPHNSRTPEIEEILRAPERARISAFWDVTLHYKIVHGMLSVFPKPVALDTDSKLHWVLDGIVVSSEPLVGTRTPFSLQLFVDASGCPTDIGGHRFRDSEEFEKRRIWVMELIAWIGKEGERLLPSVLKLPGTDTTVWNSLSAGLTHMPLNHAMEYFSGAVANSLRETRSVRSALLEQIRFGWVGIGNLRYSRQAAQGSYTV